jgi:hypothetical protein
MSRTRRPCIAWAGFPHRGVIVQKLPYLRVTVEHRDGWTDYLASSDTHQLLRASGMAEAHLHGREGTFDLDGSSVIFTQRRVEAASAIIHAAVEAFLNTEPPKGGLRVVA